MSCYRFSVISTGIRVLLLLFLTPVMGFASDAGAASHSADFTHSYLGYLGVIIFVLAYSLVPFENKFHLRKSKPVMLAAGLIWVLVAIAYIRIGDTHTAHEAIRHSLLEYAELFLFLLAAMTYINAMEERNIFQALRAFLVSRGFSLRKIFWTTGVLAFLISPIADNLTTALLMGAVVMAVGGKNRKFIALACVNVVVAANAGGAFSPFGDITTLMVWQKGKIDFLQFFSIFLPSVINWLIPAIIMSFFVPKGVPKALDESVKLKYGAWGVVILFLFTIATAVSFHNFLHLPPAAGMMLGLGYLGIFSFHIKQQEGRLHRYDSVLGLRHKGTDTAIQAILNRTTKLAKIIDKLPAAAFAIDKEHSVTHWNKEMEELTGIPAEEALGSRNQWKPFYNEQRPAMADLILNYMPDKEMERHYLKKHRKGQFKDVYEAVDFFPHLGDEGRWIAFSAAPLKDRKGNLAGAVEVLEDYTERQKKRRHFDLMERIARAEWDTLLFFYGVILCVGGLSQFGYLTLLSGVMYGDLGVTMANSLVGVLSAIVDNIPVMFAVLTMDPTMSVGQWLLVTLTAGTGGSMLAIGSAAGVALMGTARGTYTFGAHLKWTPVIALGYVASILCHLLINAKLM